mgnify:CR=1 FL=1
MKKIIITLLFSIVFLKSAYADMDDADKNRAWEFSGIYMANYFLPSGETFEYSMKEKSMASVKVLKAYALQCLKLNLRSYAYSALEELKMKISKDEYDAFETDFEALEKETIAKDW